MGKKHPWKVCPAGYIFVRGHQRIINGVAHAWSEHCRIHSNNQVKNKEILNSDEIVFISEQFANYLKEGNLELPKPYDFGTRNNLGNKYDLIIAGWLKYWTDIFGDNTNIKLGVIKTLIMSESSFEIRATAQVKNSSHEAIGLMQITDGTFKLLGEDKKELRNHFFNIKREDLFNPSVNIAVGVRWLFRKREIAKHFLKKEPSPLELAEEYKGIRNDPSAEAKKQRKSFVDWFKKYNDFKTPE